MRNTQLVRQILKQSGFSTAYGHAYTNKLVNGRSVKCYVHGADVGVLRDNLNFVMAVANEPYELRETAGAVIIEVPYTY